MSIFIILRLVQCTCFALYVLWNKWSTVMVTLVVYFLVQFDTQRQVFVGVFPFLTKKKQTKCFTRKIKECYVQDIQ